jgi:hypothetical protein
LRAMRKCKILEEPSFLRKMEGITSLWFKLMHLSCIN